MVGDGLIELKANLELKISGSVAVSHGAFKLLIIKANLNPVAAP